MKIKLIMISILISLSSHQTIAQDCGELLDGEVRRLDQPGQSLGQSTVQDQDGIGTCYANSASLMLQSALPEHPDVSYINLALQNAEKINSKTQGSTFAYDKNGEMLITGGLPCDAINAAKTNGGVCKRSDVQLEDSLFHSDIGTMGDPGSIQKMLISKISDYYDKVNKEFNPTSPKSVATPIVPVPHFKMPEIPAQYQKTLETTSEKIGVFANTLLTNFKKFFNSFFNKNNEGQVKKEELSIIIPKEVEQKEILSNDPTPLKENEIQPILEQKVESEIVQEKKPAPLDQTKPATEKETYQQALSNLLKYKMPEYAQKNCENLDSKNAFSALKNLAAYVTNLKERQPDSKISRALSPFRYNVVAGTTAYSSGSVKTYEFEFNKNVKKIIEDDYLGAFSATPAPQSGNELFAKVVSKMTKNEISPAVIQNILSELDPEVSNKLEEDFKRYAKKDYSQCTKDPLEYLKNNDGLIKDFSESTCLSRYLNLAKSIQDYAIGLEKSNVHDISQINNFLLNANDLTYDQAIALTIAPTCTEEKKIKIPEGLNCSSENIIFTAAEINNSDLLKKRISTEKAKLKNTVVKSMIEQKAMSLSVCSIFFKSDPNYFFNKTNNCEGSVENGRHAITVIGYRCQAGKLDYLIQNSWGEWSDLNSKYEREGKFGKAWFNEEDIIKNTYHYSHMNSK